MASSGRERGSRWRRHWLLSAFLLSWVDAASASSCPTPPSGDPSLVLNTNVALIGDEKHEFGKSAVTVIASVLRESEDNVAICINDQQFIMWGGSSEPAALGCVYSVGAINQRNNVAITSGLSALLFSFGIKPERVHFNFFDVPTENCRRPEAAVAQADGTHEHGQHGQSEDDCIKVCVRDTVAEKRALHPKSIDEIQLPVIKYGCKRRCGEKQMAASVDKVAENIQKVEEILEHIHSEHLMGDGEGDEETAPETMVTVMGESLTEQQLIKMRDKKELKALKEAAKAEKKRRKAEACAAATVRSDEDKKARKKREKEEKGAKKKKVVEAAGRRMQEAADGLTAAEESWHSDWGERLECWFIGLSLFDQGMLGSCLGALGLHLGSRLRAALGGAPPAATGAAAEPGCELLDQRVEELGLPEFPELGGFEFGLPPIPRLLPSWERLQALAEEFSDMADMASEPDHLGLIAAGTDLEEGVELVPSYAQDPQQPRPPITSEIWVPLAAGGAGGAALALIYLAIRSMWQGRLVLRHS